MDSKLIYIGRGAAIIGVPARDLTGQDIQELQLDEARLIASGLYQKANNEPPAPKKGRGKEGE